MSTNSQPLGPAPGLTVLPRPALPVPQLESLKFKATQIIDSIHALQWTIEAGGHPAAMPAWPDILSKYSMLLSQTHNFSTALVHPFPTTSSARASGQNIYERIALHPSMTMADAQLDGEVVPLLRNQQTTDVLRTESDTVRKLAEHMSTRGSLAVLGLAPPPPPLPGLLPRKPEYEDVLQECAEIRGAHDRRVDRAVRAVTMLREKFDWKQRVEVEVEEPEELDWDPRLGHHGHGHFHGHPQALDAMVEDEDVGMDDSDDSDDSDEKDENNVEGALTNPDATSPIGV